MLVDHSQKIKKKFNNLKKQEIQFIFTKMNLIKQACFQHDMASRNSKDIAKRTASNNVLRNQAFNIAKTPKYDEYQRRLASMVYNFLIKSRKEVVLMMKLKKISVL